jgi:hypothetical protein
MVVIREAEIVLNPIDRVSSVIDGIFSRLSRLTGEKIVPIDLDKKIFKNLDTTQDRLNALGKKTVNIKVADNSTEIAKNVMGKFEGLQNAFSQPLHITVIDQISRHIDSVGKQLDILRAKAIIPMGLSTGAAAIGLAAGVVGVAAVGMGVAATIPAAADLEASMIRVNKLIGMEGEAAKGVQKDMQDMMMATGKGLDQIAAAYEVAGGAGIGGDLMAAGDMEGARKEISDFVRITLEASSAFGMTADATSSMLSGIANVYKPIGAETNEFLRSVGSGIDAVADATIASEEKILTAMSHASSAMSMFEQTDETVKGTIALSAALISTNLSGDAAGESIKDFYNYAKTDADNKISKSLGMKSEDYQAKLKSDPMAIVEAVAAKYNTMKASEQGEYSKLFGMTGGKILQLSGSENFKAGLAKAQGVVNPAYDEGTKMSESFGKSLAGTWTQLDKIRQTVTVLAQVIGSVFLPGLNAILGVVNTLLSPMVKFVIYVAELAAKIPGMNLIATAVSILAVVTAVGALASFLGPVIAGLGLASKAMMILSMYGNIAGLAISAMAGTIGTIVGILGGPLTIILVLAAAVGYLLYKTGYLQKAWDKFKDSAIGKDLIGGLVTGIAWVTEEFSKLFSWLDEQWAKGSEGAFGWLLGALDSVAGTFGWLFDKLDDAYESGALGKALKISLIGLFPIIALVKSLTMIAGYVRQLYDSSNIISDLLSAGKRAWEAISNGVQWLYDAARGMLSWIGDTLDDISTDVNDWLKKLWDAITGLPGSISAAIKSWFPGAGGAEDADRSPAEIQAGMAVEAKAPGAYVMGPNEQKISPSQWAMQYLFDSSGEFGNKTVYGPGGAELGTVNDFMTRDTALDTLEQAAIGGGKPSPIPGVNFSEETFLDLFSRNKSLYPNAEELYNRFESGNGKAQLKTDVAGNEYLSPTPPEAPEAPETFKNQGSMYVAYGDNGAFDVMNASGMVQRGFASEAAAKEYIANNQYAIGATFNQGGLFTGQVHEKEEIIPQAIAQKGTGPLSKILGDLQESGQDVASPVLDRKGPDPRLKVLGDLQQSGQGPSGRAVNITVEGLKVEINNPVVPDSGAAYQLTDILRRQLDPFIEETVKRKVAQYIT